MIKLEDIQNSTINTPKETVTVQSLRGKDGKLSAQQRVDTDKDGVDITAYYIISHYDLLSLCANRPDYSTTAIQMRVLKHPITTSWQKRQRFAANVKRLVNGIKNACIALVNAIKKLDEKP